MPRADQGYFHTPPSAPASSFLTNLFKGAPSAVQGNGIVPAADIQGIFKPHIAAPSDSGQSTHYQTPSEPIASDGSFFSNLINGLPTAPLNVSDSTVHPGINYSSADYKNAGYGQYPSGMADKTGFSIQSQSPPLAPPQPNQVAYETMPAARATIADVPPVPGAPALPNASQMQGGLGVQAYGKSNWNGDGINVLANDGRLYGDNNGAQMDALSNPVPGNFTTGSMSTYSGPHAVVAQNAPALPPGIYGPTGLRGLTTPQGGPMDQPTANGNAYQSAQIFRSLHPDIGQQYTQNQITDFANKIQTALPSEAYVKKYGPGAMENLGRVAWNQLAAGVPPTKILAGIDSLKLRPAAIAANNGYVVNPESTSAAAASIALKNALFGTGVDATAMNASHFAATGSLSKGVIKVGNANGSDFGIDPAYKKKIANSNATADGILGGTVAQPSDAVKVAVATPLPTSDTSDTTAPSAPAWTKTADARIASGQLPRYFGKSSTGDFSASQIAGGIKKVAAPYSAVGLIGKLLGGPGANSLSNDTYGQDAGKTMVADAASTNRNGGHDNVNPAIEAKVTAPENAQALAELRKTLAQLGVSSGDQMQLIYSSFA